MNCSTPQSLHSRVMHAEDAAAIRQLFTEVFNEDMSQEFWEWKYAGDLSQASVVFQGDELIAHYGGIGRDILWNGKPDLAVQVADVMVRKDQRRSVRKDGPFYRSFTEFISNFVGYGKRFPIAYGFPNDRVMKLATLLGLYAPVETMKEICWPPMPKRKGGLRVTLIDNSNIKANRRVLDVLWKKMAACLTQNIVGVRDSAFLERRYLAHPHKKYRILLCGSRFFNRPLGVLVLREDADKIFMMDVVADFAALPALVRQAQVVTGELGKGQLHTWCTSSFAGKFAAAGGEVHDLPISVPANIWSEGPSPDELGNRWWLMPGDTDFQ